MSEYLLNEAERLLHEAERIITGLLAENTRMKELLLELIEGSGYVDTDERIRWIELQVDKELMARLTEWQAEQVEEKGQVA